MNNLFFRSLLGWLFLFPVSLLAQLPPNQPEQDCIAAIPVCQDTYVQTNAYSGPGENPDEINGMNSCMKIGERNSVWYTFTVQMTGSLCFTIIPVDPQDDYDWALFNLTNSGCAAIYNNPSLEVACNWNYNNGCGGQTGANGSSNCPDQNEPCITVFQGQTYVLNVSNFTASNSGYTLDFSQSFADLYDDIPPEVESMSSFCHGVTVEFDEPVLCSTVDPQDFTFTGPDGPYQISAILSDNCDQNGGGYSRTFDLVVSPPIQQEAHYNVALVGGVTDFCGNPAILHAQSVWMPQPPVAQINTPGPQCQEDNQFGFEYTGPSTVLNYFWDFDDGASSTFPNPVHHYDDFGRFNVSLVIRDNNGCRDTATVPIDVLPAPVAAFDAPSAICQGDSFSLPNLSYAPGNSVILSQQWYFSDGSPTSENSPSHVFTYEDQQWVLLEVFNQHGCRDTFSQHVLVYPQPDVAFAVEEDVCIGDSAHLLYQASIRDDIADDYIVDWSWHLGDSTFLGDVLRPVHLYDTAGAFPVTLTIVSDKGCVDSLTQNQFIHQPPPPVIVDTAVCFGEPVYLEANPIKGGQTFWYESLESSAAFHEGAFYPVRPVVDLDTFYTEVVSQRGCISPRVPIYLRHHAIGEGEITLSDSVVDFPKPIVDFSLSGSILGDRYSWDLDDGTLSQFEAPAHEYAHPGQYEIKLSVVDIYGCVYHLERLLEVRNVPLVNIPSGFTPNGDGYNDEFFIGHQMLRDFSFRIFNRFGEEIYFAEAPDFRWDGTSKTGSQLKQGVYVYHLQAIDYVGNILRREGTITLIR